MTHPSIPDIVLYRAIADYLFNKAKRRQREGVYFHRNDASVADKDRLRALGIDPATGRRLQEKPDSKATAQSVTAAAYEEASSDYYGRPATLYWFINWKLMALHRAELIEPQKPERWFVLTDVTNFFDSVLHDHVAEALREFAIPPRMIGLLLFLLERLAVRDEYAHSSAIGLPIDQFDGSRTLAHLVLFPHDGEVAPLVGERRYLRWMDDQLFVVGSRAKALSVLSKVQQSLGKLHLTPNAKKTKILTRQGALRHFHLDINAELDKLYEAPYTTRRQRAILRSAFRLVWRGAETYINKGVGESGKILSRFYLVAARARVRTLRKRCLPDVLEDPGSALRVADYMRHVSTPRDFWQFVQAVTRHPEQVYPDVSLILVESLLRLEVRPEEAGEIREFAIELLKRPDTIIGGQLCAAVAPLLLLRFGDRRSLRALRAQFSQDARIDTLRRPAVRACAIVYASQGVSYFQEVESAAARLLRNHLSEMVRLLRRLLAYNRVPNRFKSRLDARREILTDTWYVDMRTLLTARLLRLNAKPAVQQWVRDWKARTIAKGVSAYDRALLERLIG